MNTKKQETKGEKNKDVFIVLWERIRNKKNEKENVITT